MKKIILILTFLLFSVLLTAAEFMPFTSISGGGTGSLDHEAVADIAAEDVAFVVTNDGNAYIYVCKNSSEAENSPFIIAPDDVGGSGLRWHLVSINFDGGTYVKNSGVAGTLLLYEANSTDVNGNGWKGPLSVSADTYFQFSNTAPTTYSMMQFATKSDTTSAQTWVPNLVHRTFTFDPKVVCDGADDSFKMFTVGDDAPSGIIIQSWSVSFEADPTTEFTATNLCRATAFIGKGGAVTMDAVTTTAGAASETTYTNINGGATVAHDQVIYLDFSSAYTEANHQVIFEIWYHVVGT